MADLFAKVTDGSVVKYPYSRDELCADHPQTSFPSEITEQLMQEFGAVKIIPMPSPNVAPYEHAVEIDPKLVSGIWQQQWVIQPLPPPASISPRQVRLLLLQQNMLADVEAMIAQQDQATQITWQYAQEFRRDDPLLTALASNLGLTNEQIDRFFIAAAQL